MPYTFSFTMYWSKSWIYSSIFSSVINLETRGSAKWNFTNITREFSFFSESISWTNITPFVFSSSFWSGGNFYRKMSSYQLTWTRKTGWSTSWSIHWQILCTQLKNFLHQQLSKWQESVSATNFFIHKKSVDKNNIKQKKNSFLYHLIDFLTVRCDEASWSAMSTPFIPSL